MHNLVLKYAGTDDSELIADLSRQTFYETFAAHNTKENMDMFMSGQFKKEDLMAEVGAPGNIFLLAYDGTEPVGYARLREHNNPPEMAGIDTMEIARIYAVSHILGKGIGKALMQECIHVALAKKKQAIWLGVWEKNQRAIDFYIRWGFEKFATHVFMLGNDAQTDWLMKKTLT
jgi:ribosomal protein S18 acetylase RimI-like enzyme